MGLSTSTAEGVTTICLARPEKKNAITGAMYAALSQALDTASGDDTIRAVVLAGQPGIFTAGNDLEDFLLRPPGPDAPVFRFMHSLMNCDVPVLAAVTGPAVGIGVTLLLHCDLVYLSQEAKLSMPFVNLGLVPEFASSLLLPQLIGPARAAELLLLGSQITAAQALALGLANAVLPATEVLAHTQSMAQRFCALPPGAVRATKQLLRARHRSAIAEAIKEEAQVFGQRLHGPEAKNAIASFMNRKSRGN